MIKVHILPLQTVCVSVKARPLAKVNVIAGQGYSIGGGDPYEGSYEFTPTRETQVIEIAEKTAQQNIVINPIPQNYGLITQIGNRLSVT